MLLDKVKNNEEADVFISLGQIFLAASSSIH